MNISNTILSGIIVLIISGIVGKYIGGKNKMSENHCDEKQMSCQRLMIEKIDNLGKDINKLTEAVNSKLFGI